MSPEVTQTQMSPLSKPQRHWKARLWSIMVVLALFAGAFFWVRGLLQENKRAQAALGAQEAVRNELQRCDGILAPGQGQFTEYEYCKTFVNTFSTYR